MTALELVHNPMRRTLVVGGISRFVEDTIAPKMSKFGLAVDWHWGVDHGVGDTLPPGCEAVVVLAEWVPGTAGSNIGKLRKMAKDQNIPFVVTSRKMSVFQADLERHGFRPSPAIVAAAVMNRVVEPQSVPRNPHKVRGMKIEERVKLTPPAPVLPEPVVALEPLRESREEAMPVAEVTNIRNEKPAFEKKVQELKVLLKVLHKEFGVDEVTYVASTGLEISRRQVLNLDVD